MRTNKQPQSQRGGIGKIGIGSYAYRWALGTDTFRPARPLTPEGLLDRAAAAGAEVVQLCENVPLADLSNSALDALAVRADRLGLVVELGTKSGSTEHLLRQIDLAARLGARLLRVVLDGLGGTLEPAADILRALLPRLRAGGIVLAVENHFTFTPRQLAEWIGAMGDPHVAACLDPLNSISRLVGPGETIAALAPLAASVHVKDVRVTRLGAGFHVAGCPLGEGLLDLRALANALAEHGRSPNFILESWMDRLDDEHQTLAEEESWVRKGLTCLRSLR